MIDLIAGPWIGEFGWELFGWQGVLRAMSPQYKRVIIIGRPGHQFIYRDFAHEYVEFVPEGNEPNMWMNEGTVVKKPEGYSGLYIQPQQMTFMPNAPQQAFIKYAGTDTSRTADFVYHARDLSKYGSGYMNWGEHRWRELIEMCGDRNMIACIGSKDGAAYYGGADFRGAPLSNVCDLLSRAGVLVGPSSGPMHLGSLCGTPHVVWSGNIINKARYEDWWNPLKTEVRTICPEDSPWTNDNKEWQPTPEEVFDRAKEFLCVA